MAQHEREIISKRTKAALAARKAKGLPLETAKFGDYKITIISSSQYKYY